ncbi:MAG: protein kinase [Myxococcales bacterium]|nr:protein kinase [Myxococcales bacterium]
MQPLPQLAPGMIFARDFKVLRHLSAGGMGAVYVVEQVSTQRQRALKIMLPELVRDPRQRERFTQEATVSARIKSDHVVEVVAAGIDDATGTPWLAMELLEGHDLAQRIERGGPMSAADAMELFRQLCHGLGAAHRAGTVHRDLKPENIFLADSRREGVPYTLKILDFGIAKVVGDNRTSASATSALGSPLWMAPEQAEQGQIRPATDVWALGLIAFHVLSAAYYWRAVRSPEFAIPMMLKEIFVDPLDPPSVRAAEMGRGGLLPPNFDAWFRRCVCRDPLQRFHDASEALAHLLPVLSGASGLSAQASTWPGQGSSAPASLVPMGPTGAPAQGPPAVAMVTPHGYASMPTPYGPGVPATQAAYGAAQQTGWPGAQASFQGAPSPPSGPLYAPYAAPQQKSNAGLVVGLIAGVAVLAGLVGAVGFGLSGGREGGGEGGGGGQTSSVPGLSFPSLPNPAQVVGPQCRGTGVRTDVVGLGSVTGVSAGRFHVCATLRDGSARCWGWNQQHQLGDGSDEDQYTPVAPQGLAGVSAVGAGMTLSCAVMAGRGAACWGIGARGPQERPTMVSGAEGATQVAVGNMFACARIADGTARCWGIASSGELGDGTTLPRLDARPVTGLAGVQHIAAGGWHVCAVVTGGAVYCWGKGETGQLGNGHRGRAPVTQPAPVLALPATAMVAAGDSHTCALHTNGTVSCWGQNDQGQCGTEGSGVQMVPTGVPGLNNVVRISAGFQHTCALRRDGRVFCWGANYTCQLGTGALMASRGPHEVEGLAACADVSAGGQHTCVLTTAGTVRCWGFNNYGQLGNGNASATVDHSMQPR